MLHIIDHFPVTPSELERTSSGDTVLFTQNAVYAVMRNNTACKFIKQAFVHLNCCVLGRDMTVRGVARNDLLRGVSVIDERDFVDITENTTAIRSWN
ncbi:MAG: sulfurtransferase complex subunit TusB [Gammaproteobacteria bacterium]